MGHGVKGLYEEGLVDGSPIFLVTRVYTRKKLGYRLGPRSHSGTYTMDTRRTHRDGMDRPRVHLTGTHTESLTVTHNVSIPDVRITTHSGHSRYTHDKGTQTTRRTHTTDTDIVDTHEGHVTTDNRNIHQTM